MPSLSKGKAPVEPRIAAAVGVAVVSNRKELSKAIEAAMSQAVLDAAEQGITEPEKIKEMMQAARQKVSSR